DHWYPGSLSLLDHALERHQPMRARDDLRVHGDRERALFLDRAVQLVAPGAQDEPRIAEAAASILGPAEPRPVVQGPVHGQLYERPSSRVELVWPVVIHQARVPRELELGQQAERLRRQLPGWRAIATGPDADAGERLEAPLDF